MGAPAGIRVGRECMVVSFDYLKMQQIQLGRTRLPICPTGPAIISQSPGGPLRVAGRINNLALAGRVGSSPMRLNAGSMLVTQGRFNASNASLRLGKSRPRRSLSTPARFAAVSESGAAGTLSGADAVIGTVPLRLSDMDGRWRFAGGAGDDRRRDAGQRPRRPAQILSASKQRPSLQDGRQPDHTTGVLRHPASGTLVTNVDLEHNLVTGNGQANLDVPGIAFGPGLQPEELTPVTEGVVALVNGVLAGRGRINWTGSGTVTSTGDFATATWTSPRRSARSPG